MVSFGEERHEKGMKNTVEFFLPRSFQDNDLRQVWQIYKFATALTVCVKLFDIYWSFFLEMERCAMAHKKLHLSKENTIFTSKIRSWPFE